MSSQITQQGPGYQCDPAQEEALRDAVGALLGEHQDLAMAA